MQLGLLSACFVACSDPEGIVKSSCVKLPQMFPSSKTKVNRFKQRFNMFQYHFTLALQDGGLRGPIVGCTESSRRQLRSLLEGGSHIFHLLGSTSQCHFREIKRLALARWEATAKTPRSGNYLAK